MLVLAPAASGKSVVLTQLGVTAARAMLLKGSDEDQSVVPLKIPLVVFAGVMQRAMGEALSVQGVLKR